MLVIQLIIAVLVVVGVLFSRHAAGRYLGMQTQGNRERPPTPHNGAEIARLFLESEGIHDVEIVIHNGITSNYFDPKRRRLFLTKDVAGKSTMAAWAIALHEAAHATQVGDAKDELIWRQKVIRMTRYGPMFGIFIAIALFLMRFPNKKMIIFGFIGLCVIFLLLNVGTLAIEFNANSRLRRFIERHLERWPTAITRLEGYLSAVASREIGDLVQSPRYFFFSALPGSSKIRPTSTTDTPPENTD